MPMLAIFDSAAACASSGVNGFFTGVAGVPATFPPVDFPVPEDFTGPLAPDAAVATTGVGRFVGLTPAAMYSGVPGTRLFPFLS